MSFEQECAKKIVEVKAYMKQHNLTPKEREEYYKRLQRLYEELKQEAMQHSNYRQRLDNDLKFIESESQKRGLQ